jgi:hypothetical protein
MTDWRDQLGSILNEAAAHKVETQTTEFARFMADVALPAFAEIAGELEKHGRQVLIRNSETSATMIVNSNRGEEEMIYRLQGRMFPQGELPYAEVRFRERKGLKLITVESMLRSGAPNYPLADVQAEEIINNFLDHYKRRVQND